MSRQDRTLKLKSRLSTTERVVKCSLNGLFSSNVYDNEKIKSAIRTRVFECSIRTRNATLALNLLIRKLFDRQDDVTIVEIPEFWNQTFLRQLMLGTKGAQKPVDLITDLFKEFPLLLSSQSRSFGDRNIYSAAAIKLCTNIKNHLMLNLPSVIKTFLYKCCSLDKSEAVEALYLTHGWTSKKDLSKGDTNDRVKVEAAVDAVRKVLGLKTGQTIDESWMKDNLRSILRLFVSVNRTIEALKHEDKPRLFNILPICKIKSHFITIDTFTFYHILKEVELIKEIPKTFDSDIASAMWRSVFDVDRLQGKNMTFTCTIETDGVAVSVHFQRPKICKQDGQSSKFEGKRIIGVDPGRTNIYQMVEKLNDGTFKGYRYTRRQYYTEAGMYKAQQETESWQKNVKSELLLLSKHSPKYVLLDKFLDFIEITQTVSESLWNEYTKDRWSSQRLNLYGGKKRAFAKFFNTLKVDKNTVFAYGSAVFAPGGKGEVSVPTTRAFKECTFRAPVVPICEFRTTVVHWEDDSLLEKVARRGKDGRLVAVRGLSWCRSTKREGKFVNRDLNAAINILRCAVLPKRPMSLTRTLSKVKYVQPIGKTIKC